MHNFAQGFLLYLQKRVRAMKKRRESLDSLDYKLLGVLAENPTDPYAKVKEKLGVSIGTVYLRVNRLKEWGVIKGTQLILDPKKLGYSFEVAIRLHTPDIPAAIKALESRREVSSVYVVTGELNLLVHVYLRDVSELHGLLQHFREALKADRTEVQIILEQPIRRGVPLPEVGEARASTSHEPPNSGSSRGRRKK